MLTRLMCWLLGHSPGRYPLTRYRIREQPRSPQVTGDLLQWCRRCRTWTIYMQNV